MGKCRAFVLLIVLLFHKCRSTPHFGGNRYTGCSPIHSFFSPHAVPVRRCVAFEAAEDRDTFLIPALRVGNVQDSRFVIDGEVKPLHHAVLHENIHEKLIPAPFLCQQIAFKLAAATPFQFQQHPLFPAPVIPERKYRPDSNALCG